MVLIEILLQQYGKVCLNKSLETFQMKRVFYQKNTGRIPPPLRWGMNAHFLIAKNSILPSDMIISKYRNSIIVLLIPSL